jgi:hypothetical protein
MVEVRMKFNHFNNSQYPNSWVDLAVVRKNWEILILFLITLKKVAKSLTKVKTKYVRIFFLFYGFYFFNTASFS